VLKGPICFPSWLHKSAYYVNIPKQLEAVAKLSAVVENTCWLLRVTGSEHLPVLSLLITINLRPNPSSLTDDNSLHSRSHLICLEADP
jgi:hypothetical protein